MEESGGATRRVAFRDGGKGALVCGVCARKFAMTCPDATMRTHARRAHGARAAVKRTSARTQYQDQRERRARARVNRALHNNLQGEDLHLRRRCGAEVKDAGRTCTRLVPVG